MDGFIDENGFIIKNSNNEDTPNKKWSTNKPDILLQQSSSQTPDPVSSFRTFQVS